MGKKPITKMSIENRAKQFMPFAAVTGLDKAIRQVEERREREEIENRFNIDPKKKTNKNSDNNQII